MKFSYTNTSVSKLSPNSDRFFLIDSRIHKPCNEINFKTNLDMPLINFDVPQLQWFTPNRIQNG